MKNLTKFMVASVVALASMGANAELISTDLSTFDDGLATLDTETGIEWLDLTQTDGMSITQVESLLDSTFAGWRLPTSAEATEMMNNHFLSIGQLGSTNITGTESADLFNEFQGFFGLTNNTATTQSVRGLIKNDTATGLNPFAKVVQFGGYSAISPNVTHTYTHMNDGVTSDYNFSNASYGIYLVSDGGVTISSINNPSLNINNINAPINAVSVPLPATGALLALAMLGFGVTRKKKASA